MQNSRIDGAGLMPLDDVLLQIDERVAAVTDIESVPLGHCFGRILAETVRASVDLPPAAVSAVDGYGFFSDDASPQGGNPLRIVGRVPAGAAFSDRVGPGEAVRVFTGAPVPEGVDSVAMQEDCAATGGAVTVNGRVGPGANIRHAGTDVRAGAVVLGPGCRLRAQEVGVAAAVGRTALAVRRPLRVALFSTGDELRAPGVFLPPGAIYDANRYSVHALLAGLGAQVTDLGILPDRRGAVLDALERGSDHDLIVTSGGVSVGEEDHVRAAVMELGSIDTWRLAVKPGKPLAFGRIGRTAFLGLPGNPVSAMVMFMLVGRPLILRLSGGIPAIPLRFGVTAGFDFSKRAGRREFLRGWIEAKADGSTVARKVVNDSSGDLTSLTRSAGLIDVPAETTGIKAGDRVDFIPFSELAW